MNARQRAEIWIEAAKLARDNARTRRHMAKQWPSDRREWIERDLECAHEAFKRAYDYLKTARYLRAY